jgi:hypothetical protein
VDSHRGEGIPLFISTRPHGCFGYSPSNKQPKATR